MRKTLVVAFALASLGVLAAVQPAAAVKTCMTVCDQWGIDHYDQLRCYSSHKQCILGGALENIWNAPKSPSQPISSGGGGAQHGKLKSN
jgi:hypothetical protein